MRTRTARQVERQVQAAIVRYHELAVGAGRALLFAVPNGEKRDEATARMLVAQGVTAGAPDLVLLLGGGATVLIEVKRPATLVPQPGSGPRRLPAGRQSAKQQGFQAAAESLGHRYVIVRSLDDYVALLDAHGIGRLRAPGDMAPAAATPRGRTAGRPRGRAKRTEVMRP